VSVYLHFNVNTGMVSLDVVVAVDGPSSYVFSWLLHDGLKGGVFDEGPK